MSSKKKYASLWKCGETFGITLHTPFLSMSLKDDEYETGHREIEKLELPHPMTSNQFNKFITSNEGKEWAKPHLDRAMQQKEIDPSERDRSTEGP